MWFTVSSLSPHNLHLLFCCLLFSLAYAVCLCCYQKRFNFSLKIFLSLPGPSFLVWDFTCLLLGRSIPFFLFPFFFSGYLCSVDACVVCIVPGGCNQSSTELFYVIFKLLYRCIDAMLNAGESPSSFITTSSQVLKALWIVTNFLVILPICSGSLVHFKNSLEYLTKGTAQVFIPLMRFPLRNVVSSRFLVLLTYFSIFFFHFCIIIIIIIPSEFYTLIFADGFCKSLSDSNSPLVSKILLSTLADHNNIVAWMVFICPLISMSSTPVFNHLMIVPKAPITIDIIVTFKFYSFFNSLAKSRYLSFFSLSFNFTLWSAGTAKSKILHFLSFWLIIIRSDRLAEIRWPVYISKSHCSLCVLFSRTDVGLRIYHLFVWSNFNFLHKILWITLPSLSCLVLYAFRANLLHSLIMWLIVLPL